MAEITQREDCLYIYKIGNTIYDNSMHRVRHILSEEHIFFDKGRACYYRGFDNPYLLIGLFRTIFGEPCRSEVMQTSHQLGNIFVIGNQGFVAMWTGDWNPLERMGFVGVLFNTQSLNNMINDIMRNYEENGELKDRC